MAHAICFAFSGSNEFFFSAHNRWAAHNLPPLLETELKGDQYRFTTIYNVAVGPKGKWYVSGKQTHLPTNHSVETYAQSGNLPVQLLNWLSTRAVPTVRVVFGAGDAYFAYDHESYCFGNLPFRLQQNIDDIARGNGPDSLVPRLVALGPGGSYFFATTAGKIIYDLAPCSPVLDKTFDILYESKGESWFLSLKAITLNPFVSDQFMFVDWENNTTTTLPDYLRSTIDPIQISIKLGSGGLSGGSPTYASYGPKQSPFAKYSDSKDHPSTEQQDDIKSELEKLKKDLHDLAAARPSIFQPNGSASTSSVENSSSARTSNGQAFDAEALRRLEDKDDLLLQQMKLILSRLTALEDRQAQQASPSPYPMPFPSPHQPTSTASSPVTTHASPSGQSRTNLSPDPSFSRPRGSSFGQKQPSSPRVPASHVVTPPTPDTEHFQAACDLLERQLQVLQDEQVAVRLHREMSQRVQRENIPLQSNPPPQPQPMASPEAPATPATPPVQATATATATLAAPKPTKPKRMFRASMLFSRHKHSDSAASSSSTSKSSATAHKLAKIPSASQVSVANSTASSGAPAASSTSGVRVGSATHPETPADFDSISAIAELDASMDATVIIELEAREQELQNKINTLQAQIQRARGESVHGLYEMP